jgi:uncharacterized caspase-like protein
MKRVAAVLAALAVLNGARAAAPEESRLALIIGNAAYSIPDAKLANAANDARLVAETLRELGFRVRLLEDADHAAMRRTIREFEDELRREGGVAFLYFAGHGAQLEGHNYLMPVGAAVMNELELRSRTVDATELIERLRATGSRLNIVILDACRNNPLYKPTVDARGLNARVGLASMPPAAGTVVAFATESGRVASDGSTGHGVYAKYLVHYMRTPGLPLEQLFKRVREAVAAETKGRQVPVEFSALTGADFYFVRP